MVHISGVSLKASNPPFFANARSAAFHSLSHFACCQISSWQQQRAQVWKSARWRHILVQEDAQGLHAEGKTPFQQYGLPFLICVDWTWNDDVCSSQRCSRSLVQGNNYTTRTRCHFAINVLRWLSDSLTAWTCLLKKVVVKMSGENVQ